MTNSDEILRLMEKGIKRISEQFDKQRLAKKAAYVILYIQSGKVHTEPKVYTDGNIIRKCVICGTVILEIVDDFQISFIVYNPVFPDA